MDDLARIKGRFAFLFNDYGYQVVANIRFDQFGNWLAVMESPDCGRFLVLHDRGAIIVALGPHSGTPAARRGEVNGVDWREGPWYDAAVVAEYLSHGQDMLQTGLQDIDQQLGWWAIALRPYMDQVRDLFGDLDVFETARADLDRIGERREAELGM